MSPVEALEHVVVGGTQGRARQIFSDVPNVGDNKDLTADMLKECLL